MTISFYPQKQRAKRLHDVVVSLGNTFLHTYINKQTQSVDCAIMQSYMVQQPHMGSYCKYNQCYLITLSMGDK